MPDWWKALPKEEADLSLTNMRRCVGMVDYYKKSIAIPLWSDLSITVNSDRSINWQFSDNTTVAVHHARSQYGSFLENYTHMKIESPWLFTSEKGVDWIWSHPVYNYKHNDDVVSLPGVTNFYYQHATQINLFVRANEERRILIPHNSPMAVITPLSDRRVEIVRHLVDKDEISRLEKRSIPIKFRSKYKQAVNTSNKFSDCPFHNDTKG